MSRSISSLLQTACLDSHGKIYDVTGWIDPDHKTGRFLLFCYCSDFIEASDGKIYGGCFKKAIQFAEVLKVLNGHENASPIDTGEPAPRSAKVGQKVISYFYHKEIRETTPSLKRFI